MKLSLHIWRQASPSAPGSFEHYELGGASPDMSFLDVLDRLNLSLIEGGAEPVAFDHDCREGICGTCGLVINGVPHGPRTATTTCQLYLRDLQGARGSGRSQLEFWVEPLRAKAFPVLKDLIVDRSALDRIVQAGGYVSIQTGGAPEASRVAVAKWDADDAFDAATCIGCGACVAACPNASASLFTAAKVVHLARLPQGQPERATRSKAMATAMEDEGFGHCSNHRECEAVCPQRIDVLRISFLNRELERSDTR